MNPVALKSGQGDAYIFDAPKNDVYDYLNAQTQERKKLAAMQEKERALQEKSRLEDLEDLDKLAITGDVEAADYLSKQVADMREEGAKYLSETKFSGNLKNKLYPKIQEYKKKALFAEDLQKDKMAKAELINKNGDKISDDQKQEYKAFLALPFEQQYTYVLKNGKIPQLGYKPDAVNYETDLYNIGSRSKVKNPYSGDEQWDSASVKYNASNFVNSGLKADGSNPKAEKFLRDVQIDFDNDPTSRNLPEDQKAEVFKQKAIDEAIFHITKSHSLEKGRVEEDKEDKIAARARYAVDGNRFSNNKWSFVNEGNGVVRVSDLRGAGENKPMKFIYSGVPKRDKEGKVVKDESGNIVHKTSEEVYGIPISIDYKNGVVSVSVTEKKGDKQISTIEKIPISAAKSTIEGESLTSLEEVKNAFGVKTLREEKEGKPSDSKIKEAPHGQIVSQGGKKYKWNGAEYKEIK